MSATCRVIFVTCLLWAVPSAPQTVDQVAGATVFLYKSTQKVKDGKPVVETKYGTGFLVAVDENALFLVTAEHVSADVTTDFKTIIRGDNDTPSGMSSEELTGVKEVTWVSHGVENIAVARLHPSNEAVAKLQGHFMRTSLISSDGKAPDRERPLLTLGFPLELGVIGHFLPISRESKPSSGLITLLRPDTKKPAIFFLLGDPSIAGFSGAPLLLTAAPYSASSGMLVMPERGSPIRCVGVVHGTIKDDHGFGMAAITPSNFVLETIEKAMGK